MEVVLIRKGSNSRVLEIKNVNLLVIVRLALPANLGLFFEHDDLVALRLECMGSAQASRSSANDADRCLPVRCMRARERSR